MLFILDAQIGFASDSYIVSEGAGRINLLVTSGGANPESVTVPYRIEEGTAQGINIFKISY